MLTIVTNESAADHPTAPDPTALRALAHPLRWQLMDLIGSETTATATRCAEVLGQSVASCSYHLGILGKYGYIELVPGQAGKEKPWRLASRQQNLDPSGLDTEGALAAEAAAPSRSRPDDLRSRSGLASCHGFSRHSRPGTRVM